MNTPRPLARPSDRRLTRPGQRRGTALVEFVLFLPFLFFVILMIFHFGVSNLRKQRTIVAARFGADAWTHGLGDSNPNDYWEHPVSGTQYPRGQAYPDPQHHYLGLVAADRMQALFLPRVLPENVETGGTQPDDGLDRLKQEVDARDNGDPRVVAVTETFWERLATTQQQIGGDFDYRWHRYARGVRVRAGYAPEGPTFEQLQGPLGSHSYREAGSWALPRPDMWWELTHSPAGLGEIQQVFYELAQDPAMGVTGEAMFRWFRH